MDLYKCTECILRASRPMKALRDGSSYLSKRPRTNTNIPRSNTIITHRMFSSSRTRQADRTSPVASPSQQPKKTVDVSKLFESNVANSRSRPIQRNTPSLSQETPATNSLLALLDSFKDRPSTAPLNTMVDAHGKLLKPVPLKLEPAPFKLGPTLGRTIKIDESRGRDVGAAFRMLDTLARRNSIRRDAMAQRFYERPGLKRKRLKSQRYRARFKQGFREMVSRVQTMRKMGW